MFHVFGTHVARPASLVCVEHVADIEPINYAPSPHFVASASALKHTTICIPNSSGTTTATKL